MTWRYCSRIDVTSAMLTGQKTGPGAGPCEPTMATLRDGRILAAFRLSGGPYHLPIWMAYSSDKCVFISCSVLLTSPYNCTLHLLRLLRTDASGETWTDPEVAAGRPASSSRGAVSTVFGVWPQLLMLSNGIVFSYTNSPNCS